MKKKKVKIKYNRILIFLVIIGVMTISLYNFFNLKITNTYISGENLLTEQEILEIAKIDNYPNIFEITKKDIINNLENHTYIKSANVETKNLTEVYIEIEENTPLFYYEYNDLTILKDGTSVDKIYNTSVVSNYITDNCYTKFIDELGQLDLDILNKIETIIYEPNEVDDERFLLSMNDGNQIYINIETFYKLNHYFDIITSIPKDDGILYLDYGNNFEVLE